MIAQISHGWFEHTIEVFSIVLGAIAVASSFAMFVYFVKTDKGIGRAVAYDKLAESVNASVILIFAVTYAIGVFEVMPLIWAVILRSLASVATTLSSWHLAYQAQRILRGSSDDRGNE